MDERDFIDELKTLLREYDSLEKALASDSEFSRTFSRELNRLLQPVREKPITSLDKDTIEEIKSAFAKPFIDASRSRSLPVGYRRDLKDFGQELEGFIERLASFSEVFDVSLSGRFTGQKSVKPIQDLLDNMADLLPKFGKSFKEFIEIFEANITALKSNLGFKELTSQEISRMFSFRQIVEKSPLEAFYLLGQDYVLREPLRAFYGYQLEEKGLSEAIKTFRNVFSAGKETYNQLPFLLRISDEGQFTKAVSQQALSDYRRTIVELKTLYSEELKSTAQKLAIATSPEERASLLKDRIELAGKLIQTIAEEDKIRREANKELTEFSNKLKSLGVGFVDTLFSVTRNPFVDIFTASLRTAFTVGSSATNALRNILPPGSITIPGYVPPQSNRPTTGRPEETPGRAGSGGFTFGRSFLRGAGTFSILSLGIDAASNISREGLTEGLKDTFTVGNVLKTLASGAVGGLVGTLTLAGGPVLSLLAGSAAATGTKFLLDRLFPEEGKAKSFAEGINLSADALANLSKSALGASSNVAGLGIAAGSLSLGGISGRLGGAGSELLALGGGVLAGATAGFIDFYLQTLNKSYDTFYSRYSQLRIIPQQLREQLGRNVSEMSAQFVPGIGRLGLTGLGFTTEEYLATASRLAAGTAGIVTSVDNFKNALINSARFANLFGISISEAAAFITNARRAMVDERRAARAGFIATGEYSAFSEAVAQGLINASRSLALRQGILNVQDYLLTNLSVQTALRNVPQLSEFIRRNPEVAQNFVSTFNEFIRGAFNNPVALGIGIRAGMTPLDFMRGATPENLVLILRRLAIETGAVGQFIGGQFTPLARQNLLPIMQNILGLQNVPPEVFANLLASAITGDLDRAKAIAQEELGKPPKLGRPPDEAMANQLDTLSQSMQLLTKTMQDNIKNVTELNVSVLELSNRVLQLSGTITKPLIGIFTDAFSFGAQAIGLPLNPSTFSITNSLLQKPQQNIPLGIAAQGNVGATAPLQIQGQTTAQITPKTETSRGTYVFIINGEVSSLPLDELKEALKRIRWNFQ